MADKECSFLCFKGGFLQRLATGKFYVFSYGLLGLILSAVGSYIVAILSTVEKRFQIPSQTSGIIISGLDVGTCIAVVFLAFFGNKLHRPRMLAFGTCLGAVACIFWYMPYVIYGTGKLKSSTDEKSSQIQQCEWGSLPDEVCDSGDETLLATIIFLLGNVIYGTGMCFYWILGLTYIDDNARKSKTPIYLATIMLIRMFGPTLGFMLGAYSLSLKSNLSDGVTLELGSWWLGFRILLVLLMPLMILIYSFPKHLPKTFNKKNDEANEDPNQITFSLMQDFRSMLSRLLKNKIVVYNTISSTFFAFEEVGFGTFVPKYLEAQFQKSSSEASFVLGAIGLLCSGLGILASGIVIYYFKPSSRKIALWNVITEVLAVIRCFGLIFLGCPAGNLRGHWSKNEEWSLFEDCNKHCDCPSAIKYTPLCSKSSEFLFYSPCHAGCNKGSFNKSSKAYFNCSCSIDEPLIQGDCPITEECQNEFHIFVILVCIMGFFGASGRAGNTLVQLRSVKDEDKAVSFAFSEAVMSVFAFIPAPIVFGMLLDKTCIVWGESCNKSGNCWLYNSKTMRYYLNFTAAACLIFGTLADVVVWRYSSEVEMYEKEENSGNEEEIARNSALTSDLILCSNDHSLKFIDEF